MKHYEERTQTVTGEYLKEVTCDLCGKSTENDRDWDSGLKENDYDSNDHATVKYENGHHDEGYGGYTKTLSVDICPECFMHQLVPWLNSQGCQLQESDLYW